MEQSFENENTYDGFMNKDGRWTFARTWIKCKCPKKQNKRILENNEEKMKESLKRLHAQRLFWKPNSIRAFYYVNDTNKLI
jgi:hypothetical protein